MKRKILLRICMVIMLITCVGFFGLGGYASNILSTKKDYDKISDDYIHYLEENLQNAVANEDINVAKNATRKILANAADNYFDDLNSNICGEIVFEDGTNIDLNDNFMTVDYSNNYRIIDSESNSDIAVCEKTTDNQNASYVVDINKYFSEEDLAKFRGVGDSYGLFTERNLLQIDGYVDGDRLIPTKINVFSDTIYTPEKYIQKVIDEFKLQDEWDNHSIVIWGKGIYITLKNHGYNIDEYGQLYSDYNYGEERNFYYTCDKIYEVLRWNGNRIIVKDGDKELTINDTRRKDIEIVFGHNYEFIIDEELIKDEIANAKPLSEEETSVIVNAYMLDENYMKDDNEYNLSINKKYYAEHKNGTESYSNDICLKMGYEKKYTFADENTGRKITITSYYNPIERFGKELTNMDVYSIGVIIASVIVIIILSILWIKMEKAHYADGYDEAADKQEEIKKIATEIELALYKADLYAQEVRNRVNPEETISKDVAKIKHCIQTIKDGE